ncbi:SIR2 family protein [Pectobacterium brasiliense]|uniref:SIR2 family protein n=1 Tax=Pectobacterium brasiliense TaxID=180957 RepID=UPI002A814645|nr:SIR2 family protein [Pectobacterium brasiliense]MDY4382551.1 SIR2 family protein [Pectobacterium brasiliense]
MDYLDKLFREYLNEEGVVNIAGSEFYRDEILTTLDQSGYAEAYLEWCSQRKSDNLKKANDILAEYDLSDRFLKIKEIHSKGMLTPFVGAGLSIQSEYPAWTPFLYKMLNETNIEKSVMDDLINRGEYEKAAQLLEDNLPEGGFLEQVENKFGVEKEIYGVIQKFPSIFQSTVITTNFDNVIERCYEYGGVSFNEILLGPEAEMLPRFLGEGKTVLLKLHGKANISKSRVLTKKEYDRHYSDSKELEKVIECISQNSLLFVGCSLTVDRTIKCLQSIANRKGHENIPRHYAFLQLNDNNTRIKRQNELRRANIYPIWYTGEHDECLEALLEKLVDGVSK